MNLALSIAFCLNEGRSGAKLSVQLFNEMRRRKQKYGVVIRRTADALGPGRGRRVCLSC